MHFRRMHRLTYTSAQSIYILIVCSSCSRFEISISMANNFDCAVKYTYKLQMTELSWNYSVIIIMFSWHDCNSMNFSRITEYLSTAYWALHTAHSITTDKLICCAFQQMRCSHLKLGSFFLLRVCLLSSP